jgi:phosphoglycolate phosphatase-like HAD superfamily hydrolase
VHWNLPSNPVDLEQREGRVHRFKGHAVRKNVARAHRDAAFANDAGPDPWSAVFRTARQTREDCSSDLVPFWVCTVEGGARIERHVPSLPMSRDRERADLLRQSLTVYRMAFGQNRQEDLVAYLTGLVPADQVERVSADVAIDLSPDASERRRESGVDLVPVTGPVGPRSSESVVEVGQRVARLGEAGHRPLSYGQLRSLIDGFASVRGRLAPDDARGTLGNGARRLTAERLANLLDTYRGLAPARVSEPRGGNNMRVDLIARWTDLLDRLAALALEKEREAVEEMPEAAYEALGLWQDLDLSPVQIHGLVDLADTGFKLADNYRKMDEKAMELELRRILTPAQMKVLNDFRDHHEPEMVAEKNEALALVHDLNRHLDLSPGQLRQLTTLVEDNLDAILQAAQNITAGAEELVTQVIAPAPDPDAIRAAANRLTGPVAEALILAGDMIRDARQIISPQQYEGVLTAVLWAEQKAAQARDEFPARFQELVALRAELGITPAQKESLRQWAEKRQRQREREMELLSRLP